MNKVTEHSTKTILEKTKVERVDNVVTIHKEYLSYPTGRMWVVDIENAQSLTEETARLLKKYLPLEEREYLKVRTVSSADTKGFNKGYGIGKDDRTAESRGAARRLTHARRKKVVRKDFASRDMGDYRRSQYTLYEV